ncbi:MAG: RES family NAD+ phosphorylase [Desulfobaccales bacterium]|nr:RES family NAD+ phosphorylase [Desulfobaccales bacterium]
MSEFKSWLSFWDFWRTTIQKNRYVWPKEVEEFLQTVLSTSKGRDITISAGKNLWRAQLGNDTQPYYQDDIYIDDIPAPYRSERMKPLKGEAKEGRANPKGIPYLYLATQRDTALAEVRPWIGALVSVGQFKIMRDLKIIQCTGTEDQHLFYFEEPDAEQREKAVWCDIDRAFSRPVSMSDSTADYVPTQILAELFRSEGFDGIAYHSALGEGFNIAIFDIDAANIINCFLYKLKEINFNFKEVANAYFVEMPLLQDRCHGKKTAIVTENDILWF